MPGEDVARVGALSRGIAVGGADADPVLYPEIETTKITNVFESPVSGILRRQITKGGESVPVGALLAVLAMPFGLEGPALAAMGWSIERMLDVARLVSGWSAHLSASPLLTPLALVIGVVALAWFAFLRSWWRLLGPLLAAPLVVLLAVDRPPDVLVADTTQAMAVRGPTGLELADGKAQSFALDVWRETYAEPIATAAAVRCDSVACIGESSAGFSYAIVADPAGFEEECGRDLVVTRIRAPGWCAAGVVIDADDLASHGVHWLRWNAATETFEMRPAIGSLERPWRIRP